MALALAEGLVPITGGGDFERRVATGSKFRYYVATGWDTLLACCMSPVNPQRVAPPPPPPSLPSSLTPSHLRYWRDNRDNVTTRTGMAAGRIRANKRPIINRRWFAELESIYPSLPIRLSVCPPSSNPLPLPSSAFHDLSALRLASS